MTAGVNTSLSPATHVEIHVDRDGLTGRLQVGISEVDEEGSGAGYRLAGPKYSGTGSNELTAIIDQRAARAIIRYIAPLVGVADLRPIIEFT